MSVDNYDCYFNKASKMGMKTRPSFHRQKVGFVISGKYFGRVSAVQNVYMTVDTRDGERRKAAKSSFLTVEKFAKSIRRILFLSDQGKQLMNL